MNMIILAGQALESAASILDISIDEARERVRNDDEEINEMIFKLACAAIAQEKA